MAEFTLNGTIRDFWSWDGHAPNANQDFGYLWLNVVGVLKYIGYTLDSEDKPQVGATGIETHRTMGDANVAGWFRDGVGNMSADHSLTFVEGGGRYTFSSDPYHPIDGLLLGNEGLSHNLLWTWESRTAVFVAAPGQTFHVLAVPEVLVYIDGRLVIDRAGNTHDTFSLDTLGFEPGSMHFLKIFIAARDGSDIQFNSVVMDTNFVLEDYMVAISQWITGSGTVTPAAGAYAPGSQTVTAIPSAGYRLSTLTVAGAAHVSGAAYNFTTHATIAAAFEQTASSTAITRLKIIHRALRIIGVLTEGQLPSAAQVATAKEALSCYIKALQDKGVKLWTEEWVAHPLNTVSSTVLGTDGNYYQCIKAHTATAANCPVTGASWSTYWMKTATATTNVWASGTSYTAINQFADTSADAVDQAFIRDVYGSDTDVEIIQTVTANEIPSKIDTGVPSKLWHVKDITSPYIYMWPIPDLLTYVLHYRRVRYLNDFTSDYASGDWPQSWIDAVVFGLAARIAFEYGVPIQEREELLATAERFEHIARGFNHERPTHHRFSGCY